MLKRSSSWLQALLATALAVVALCVPGLARAQSCPPAMADALNVSLSSVVTYATGEVERTETTLVQSLNQADQCGQGSASVIAEPGCQPGQLPLGKLLAAKIFQLADRKARVFETACGNLRGTFTLGAPPYATVTGTFSLRLLTSSTAQAQINAFVPASPGLTTLFGGRFASSELIEPNGIGFAKGTGTLEVETMIGFGNLPLHVNYEFLGNKAATLPKAIIVTQQFDYDCTKGTLDSEVCVKSSVAVPATPPWALGLYGLGVVAIAWAALRRASFGPRALGR